MSLTSHIVRTLFTIGDLKRDLVEFHRMWEAIENVSTDPDKWHLLDLYRQKTQKDNQLL